MRKPFTKILVARHSPKNGCHAQDGEVLFARPMASVPRKDHVDHHFSAVGSRADSSKYGWVKEVEPFDIEDFCRQYLSGYSLEEVDLLHIETMLKAIGKLNPGTPVAAAYSGRGLGNSAMEFRVHKVIFYGT